MPNSSMSATSATSSMDHSDKALLLCSRANDLLSLLLQPPTTTDHKHTEEEEEQQHMKDEKEDDQEMADEEDDDDDDDDQDEHDFKLIQDANELFEQAIAMDSKCVDALIGLSYIAGVREQFQDAMDYMEKAELITDDDGQVDERIKTLKDALKEKIEAASKIEAEKQTNTDSNNNNNKADEFEHIFQTGHSDLNVPLLIEKGSVTKKFIVILREIFDRFDKTCDNTLSIEELQSYTKKVNGHALDRQSINHLMKSYHSNKRGLTFTGFVELYVNQTIEDANETFKDLKTLGYNQQLQLLLSKEELKHYNK